MIVPKEQVSVTVDCDGQQVAANDSVATAFEPDSVVRPEIPRSAVPVDAVEVPLEALAWGRSGDKGNKANIGIIARQEAFVPYIAAQLSEDRVEELFCHFLAAGQDKPVERFYMPGPHAFNFLLHDVLGGGGVASLRTDPQGKGYAQLLLAETMRVPAELATQFNLETL